jgi:hypothetical protein
MNGSYRVKGDMYGDGYGIVNYTVTASNYTMQSSEMTMKMNLTEEIEVDVSDYDPMTITLNGTMEMIYGSYSSKMGYENFTIHTEGGSSSYSDTQVEINGKMSVNNTTNTCANGIYSIETISPLTSHYYSGYSSGIMKVNGVTMNFNTDSTVDITYADGTSETISQSSSVVCN